mgnify:CR=1 FL=1
MFGARTAEEPPNTRHHVLVVAAVVLGVLGVLGVLDEPRHIDRYLGQDALSMMDYH